MIQVNCAIATPEIQDIASKLSKPVTVVTNAVATWLSENNTAAMPTLELLKEAFKQAELENKDFYLAVPNAIISEFEAAGNPITHIGTKIVMMELPELNALEYFYSMFNLPELKDLVLEPLEAYWFMLWREQAFITNAWDNNNPEDINKANKEAIDRLKEYKRQNPHANERLTEAHHTTVNAINEYINWAEQHVRLDNTTHTYYIDGVPADFSVSQYYQSVYGHPDFGDKYAESPAVGNSMDAIWRDYFDDTKDIFTIEYPNINDSRKLDIIKDLERFKKHLDLLFGKGLYKVITNPHFHLVARIGNKTIAGTPDMLIVDKNGDTYLYDMKAKSHSIDLTYNGVVVTDRRDYTAQQNLYRTMIGTLSQKIKAPKSLNLIWFDTNITAMRHKGNIFKVDKSTNKVTVSNEKLNITDLPIELNTDWNTPRLNSMDITKSLIPLGIMSKIGNLTIPEMTPYIEELTYTPIQPNQSNQSQQVDNTIVYTPKGKNQQTYTIAGSHIYNKDGEEVFLNDSVDRNKIFANFAIKQGRAVVVEHNNKKYVVNNKDQIISVVSGKVMQWGEENGSRKEILRLSQIAFGEKQKAKTTATNSNEAIQQEKQKLNTLKQDLGGGEQATAEVQDAVRVAKKGMSFEEALTGQEAFFSKEEQIQIKQGLNGKNLQVMSVSRLTDPAFFSKEIVSFLKKNAEKSLNDPTRVTAIEIWSKHDGLPIKDILDACKKYRVAPMVSFSITGLGGTALEGGVMKYQDMLEKIGELINNGTLNPATTTVRIDPILPGVTDMNDIENIVATAKSYGIKKFVTSLVQSYGYTEGTPRDRKVISGINNALAIEGKTYDWDKYYGRDRNGKINFKPKQEVINEIGKVLLELDKDPEITIQTCAFGINGLKVSACLDPMIIERITGVDVLRKDGTYDRDTSRPECMCYGCHGDFFKGQNKKCYSSCAYCYAAHSGDNKLNYYNEDGSLKDNDYTRTERVQQAQQNVSKYTDTTSYIPYNRPNITAESTGFSVKDTPRAKLVREFTPNEIAIRVEGIARDFSRAIDNATKTLTDELEKAANKARENGQMFEAVRKQFEIDELKDDKEGRKAVISKYGFDRLYQDVLKGYKDVAEKSIEVAEKDYGVGNGATMIRKYQKVVDNFDALLDDATVLLERYEGFRIIFDETTGDNPSSKKDVKFAKSAEELEAEEAQFGDDEDGNRVNGSEGWSFKLRFINPHSTVTNRVKRILSNVILQGPNGFEVDDLGKPRYIPEVIVYATLVNELVNLTSSDDFAIKNEEGVYEFPALDKMAAKYPWVEQIKTTLQDNPEYISQFYAGFRKEFIPYWMQWFDKGVRKSKAENMTPAEDSVMSDLYATYNKGIKLTVTPIYDTTGNVIKENAKILQTAVDNVYSILKNYNKKYNSILIRDITEVTKSLGIDVDDSLISGIVEDDNAEGIVRDWANSVNWITQSIIKGEVKNGVHLIEEFKDQYKNIAKIVGSVSELANILSFREKDKEYYSISASNFLYNMIKKFKNENFQDYINSEFKQFKWFYDESLGGWLNGWVEELEKDLETRSQLAIREHVFYKDENGDLREYNQWTPKEIEEVFITEYFSISRSNSTKKQYAMFNMPIFSDSEQAVFIKFSKFSGANYEDYVINGLYKVVLQELCRIKLVRDRLAKGAPEIMYFDKNGLKFQFFPRFNNTGLLEECIPYINSKNTKELKKRIKKALRQEMNLQFEEYLTNTKLDKESLKKHLVNEGVMQQGEDVNTFIREYYYNNAYAQTQILQLTVIDPALYKNGNDLQKRFKEIIASGTKLFTNSKYGRKTERTIYIEDQVRASTTYGNIKDALDTAVSQGRIQSFDKDNILHTFREVNGTDAQAYRTASSYRAVIDMLEGWSDDMEKALQNFKEGTWNMSDYNIVWQTLKPFMFTHIPKDNGLDTGEKIKVGHQNKNSEFLLLAMYDLISQSMGKSDKIVALNEFMEQKNIDVAQFISAVKTGGETTVDITCYPPTLNSIKYDNNHTKSAIWNQIEDIVVKHLGKDKAAKMSDVKLYIKGQELLLADGIIDSEQYNKNLDRIEPTKDQVLEMLQQQVFTQDGMFKENVVHELPYEDYVVQQPTPEHIFDVRSVFGSQFRNLITSDLPKDFTIKIKGVEFDKDQILRLYQGCIVENLLESYNDLKKEFKDIKSLRRMLLEQVKGNPKYGRDIQNVLELTKIPGEKEQKFNIPFNSPNITDILQELLLSCFKNNITKQYIKGGACIAVSNFGFTNELKIHYNKEGDKTSGIAYMDCYLPWNSKRYFKPFLKEVTKTITVYKNGKTSKKTVTYEELDYKAMPEDLKKIIGFRIPTEDKYSMFPLRIAGFLPWQNGSSIMLPMEATTLSGMDFDVDKVFLMMPEFRARDRYDIKKAWSDFYKANPKIADEINTAQWNAFITDYSTQTDIDPDQIDESKFKKEFQQWYKDKGLKSYEFVEGTRKKFNSWFKNNKEKYYLGSEIQKIDYNLDKNNPSELTAQNLNREQRNNLIIDIAHGILTHKSTIEKILNPGNFNTLKLMSRVATITGDKDMMKAFMEKFSCKSTQEASKKLHEFITTKNLDILDSFVSDHAKERNPLSPLTFAYYHQQNMVGAALIGMYANNTTAQAKFQQATGFSISPQYTFKINGRDVKNLNEAYQDVNGKTERISKMCSQWSAASVDNVKDPVLAMLLQNTKTANIAGTLIRAGVTIEEVAMLFRQPVIVDIITSKGQLSGDDISTEIAQLEKKLSNRFKVIPLSEIDTLKDLKTDGIVDENLILDVCNQEKVKDSNDVDFLKRQVSILYLFKDLILPVVEDMSELTKISRADSPNGAIEPSLSGAKIQKARLKRFLSRRTDDKFALKGLERVLDAEVNTKMSTNELRDVFFNSKMPMLQAFYSLGIDLGTQLLKDKFPQMSDSISSIVDDTIAEASDYWVFGPKDNVKEIYRDLTTFALTKTKLFGDDGTNTFWDKYTYYIYEFPKLFIEAVNSNKDVAQLPAIRRMQVVKGKIELNRSGRLDKSVKETYIRSLDSLLYMDGEVKMTVNNVQQSYPIQKLAIDLFMYAFYSDGFKFGANNYSALLSSQYSTAFPEFIEALRSIDKLMESSELQDKFKKQLWANRGSYMAITINDSSKDHSLIQTLRDGSISVVPKLVINKYKNNGELHEYVKYQGILYKLNTVGSSMCSYIPAPVIAGSPIYNANQTVEKMIEVKIDKESLNKDTSSTPNPNQMSYDDLKAVESMDNSDVTNVSDKVSERDLESMEGISNEELEAMSNKMSEDLLAAQESYYERQIEERISEDDFTSIEEQSYVEDGNNQLKEPMC